MAFTTACLSYHIHICAYKCIRVYTLYTLLIIRFIPPSIYILYDSFPPPYIYCRHPHPLKWSTLSLTFICFSHLFKSLRNPETSSTFCLIWLWTFIALSILLVIVIGCSINMYRYKWFRVVFPFFFMMLAFALRFLYGIICFLFRVLCCVGAINIAISLFLLIYLTYYNMIFEKKYFAAMEWAVWFLKRSTLLQWNGQYCDGYQQYWSASTRDLF